MERHGNMLLYYYIQIPEGEDEAAFNRHNSALKGEFKKAKPNKAVVAALMKQSFAMRRNNVLQQARPLNEMLELYPFLSDPDEVSNYKIFGG